MFALCLQNGVNFIDTAQIYGRLSLPSVSKEQAVAEAWLGVLALGRPAGKPIVAVTRSSLPDCAACTLCSGRAPVA